MRTATRLEDTPEWRFGDTAQRELAERLRTRMGRAVLPLYGFKDMTRETKAPVLFIPDGLAVLPDLLLFSRTKMPVFLEVKAKSVPTWRRLPPGPRWEHGFDYDLVHEYAAAEDETGVEVWLFIQETASPSSADRECQCAAPGRWLGISLQTALEEGQRRSDWPGGGRDLADRGRGGRGGLLWGRDLMQDWTPWLGPVTGAPLAGKDGRWPGVR